MTESRISSPKATSTEPPTAFAGHFDALVTPRLGRLARAAGLLVWCESHSFAEALELVWAEAARLGAHYLGEARELALRDWLMSELVCSIAAMPPEGALATAPPQPVGEPAAHTWGD